ncbi:hypothetical protein DID80_05155 [Candidatus Marinamargulisbacteria bacterium SCGC AAA071-K20]|nr:hypothetical protein DID80_05155 [Candidatus Marinamargulisbacteria bacterium SCGC AAA071-K20]
MNAGLSFLTTNVTNATTQIFSPASESYTPITSMVSAVLGLGVTILALVLVTQRETCKESANRVFPWAVCPSPVVETVNCKITKTEAAVDQKFSEMEKAVQSTVAGVGQFRSEVLKGYDWFKDDNASRLNSIANINIVRFKLDKAAATAKQQYQTCLDSALDSLKTNMSMLLQDSAQLDKLDISANPEEKAQIAELRVTLNKKMQDFNAKQQQLDSATNTFGVIDRKLVLYRAAIEKQLFFKKDQIEPMPEASGRESMFSRLNSIRLNQKINSRAKKVLSQKNMDALARFRRKLKTEIEATRTGAGCKVMTSAETQAAHKAMDKELGWASDFVGRVLAKPDNWVKRSRMSCFMQSGRIFASVE